MNLELQLPSFIFGLVVGLAFMLVLGQSLRFLFGERRLRELNREVNHLRRVVEQKDRYIRKSLEALEKEGAEPPGAAGVAGPAPPAPAGPRTQEYR